MSYVPLAGDNFEPNPNQSATAPLPSANSFEVSQPPHQAHSYPSIPGYPVGYNPNPDQQAYPQVPPPYYPPGSVPGSAVNYSPYPAAQPVYNYPGYGPDGRPIHQTVEWKRHSQEVLCPHCNAYMKTETHKSVGATNWLACVGIALIGFWCGCCLIPFCIDSMDDYTHKCKQCGKTLHVIKSTC